MVAYLVQGEYCIFQLQGLNATTISFPSGSIAYSLSPEASNLKQDAVALVLLNSQREFRKVLGASLRLQIPPSSWPVSGRIKILPDFSSTAKVLVALDTAPATS